MKNNYVFCTKCAQTNLFIGHYPICWYCGMPLEDPNKAKDKENFNICENMFKKALLVGISYEPFNDMKSTNHDFTLLKVLLDVDKVTEEHWKQMKQIHIPDLERY